MLLATATLLLLQAQPDEGPVLRALRFLARHQREDGSWGEKSAVCACESPAAQPLLPSEPADVEPLIRALGGDCPVRRDRAHADLRALGQRALPFLLDGARDSDPEVRYRCGALRRELAPFALGGGDAELTGLAVLAFAGAGYTHHSKDVHDGISFGTVVKKAIQWLMARQKEVGAFDPTDSVGDTIAALALSECYGLTASPIYKDDAQQAIDRVAGRAMSGTRGMIWKGMALKSAEISELTVARKAAEDNLAALRNQPGGSLQWAGVGLVSIFVEKLRGSPWLGGLQLLDPQLLDAESLYLGTSAVFQFDGPNGPLWSRWRPQYRPRLTSQQATAAERCERGSWSGAGFRGRLQATALNLMNFQFYYRDMR